MAWQRHLPDDQLSRHAVLQLLVLEPPVRSHTFVLIVREHTLGTACVCTCYHVVFHVIMSCRVVHVMSCHVVHVVLSCHVVSCMSCMSCMSSCHVSCHHITSHHITSHHITSPHITSHHITSHHMCPQNARTKLYVSACCVQNCHTRSQHSLAHICTQAR